MSITARVSASSMSGTEVEHRLDRSKLQVNIIRRHFWYLGVRALTQYGVELDAVDKGNGQVDRQSKP